MAALVGLGWVGVDVGVAGVAHEQTAVGVVDPGVPVGGASVVRGAPASTTVR